MSLVASLVLTKLDYGIGYFDLPDKEMNRLQSVLNAAARLICRARKYDNVTPLLRDLHWLRVPERITYRLSVLVYRCQHGQAPSYLASEVRRVADVPALQRNRSADTEDLVVPAARRVTIGDRAFARRCSARMEHIAVHSHYITITSGLQATAEDRTIQSFV